MRIYGNPDIVSIGSRQVRVLGSGWITSSAAQFAAAAESPERHIILDLSNIDFVTLYEWATTVAMMQRILKSRPVSTIGIDLIGEPQPESFQLQIASEQKELGKVTRTTQASSMPWLQGFTHLYISWN